MINESLWTLARHILQLSGPELMQLNEIIKREGGEPIGVREPRTPAPESPGDEIALEVDE